MTLSQDTEDGYIDLYYYGIELIGAPSNGDTITVTSDGENCSVVTDVVGAVVTIDSEAWLERVTEPGTYTITYVTAGSAWQLYNHSVVISGTDHNIITIALRTTSYGAGKNNCEIQIYSGNDKDILVTTAQFNFDGRKGIANEDTITRDPSYPLLVSLIAQVRSLVGNVGDMNKADYDPTESVQLAGGIPAFVTDAVNNGGPIKVGPMTVSNLPASVSKSSIKSSMSVVGYIISNPGALASNLTISPYNGGFTMNGTLITGLTTDITLYFSETR